METRIPGAPFSARFERESTKYRKEWYVADPAITIDWTRGADGSTEIVETLWLLVGLGQLEVHVVSDAQRRMLTGSVALAGPVARLASILSGQQSEQGRVLLNGPDPFDEMPWRPGDREDGSPRSKSRGILLGNVMLWTLDDFIEHSSSRETLAIGGDSWPTVKRVFRSPDERGVLSVWVSEDLHVVLKEELHVEGELQNSYRAVSLKLGGDVSAPAVRSQ